MWASNSIFNSLSRFALGEKQQKPSLLSEASEGVIPAMLEIEKGASRELCLQETAEKILALGSSFPKVDWRQFALMHNASIIRKTNFEGGDIGRSISVWQSYFKMWQKGEGFLFSFPLSSATLAKVLKALKDLEHFRSFLPPMALEPLQASVVENYAKRVQKELYTRLQSQKSVYLPLGYRHGISNEGHAIPVKIEWQKDGILIYPLNLGDGSSDHALLNYTTSQEKISFRFYPIKVPHSVFWGKAGLAAFCHIIRYEADPPHPDHTHYSGKDIYDIFQTLGRIIPNLGEHPELFEEKGQYSGTCSETGVENVVHDVLVDCGVEQKVTRTLFLSLRLSTLMAGYIDYVKSPERLHRYFLRNAAEEFGVALELSKEIISEEEYLSGIAIVHKIKKGTKAIPQENKKAAPLETPIADFPWVFPKVEEESVFKIESELSLPVERKEYKARLYLPKFEIKKNKRSSR